MRNKPKYFYRIFFPFILTGTVAMILFNGFAYFLSKDSLEEKMIAEKQEHVVQTMNTLEQKLQAVDYNFNSYIHDTSFKNYIRQPLTVEQFYTFESINKQLNYIASFGPSQTTVSLISLAGNWAISGNSLKPLTPEDQEQIASAYLSLPNSSTWIKDGQEDGKIKLVKQTPFYQTKKHGVVIIEIPLESLSDLIYTSSDSGPVLIYNQEGDLLYQNKAGTAYIVPSQTIQRIVNDDFNQTGILSMNSTEEEKYKVAFSKSDYNGWIYVSTIRESEFTEAMEPTIIGISSMSIFLLIITVIVAYISSDYFSEPIRELQKHIPNVKKDGTKDEFELIGNSIREVMVKNQSLENIVTSQQEQLKTLFMLHLFYGRMNEQEIQEEMQDFHYPSDWSCLYVIAIQFDSLEDGGFTRKDKDLLLFSVNQIVSEMIREEERLTPTVIDSETQATVFICKDHHDDQHVSVINGYAENIQQQIKKIFNLSISIGVSSPFQELIDCKTALLQGVDSLKYRLKIGKESIIFYESISAIYTNHQIHTYFPKVLENQLFDTIKLGETEKAKDLLHQFLTDLFQYSKSPQELELNMIRFVNDLMELMQTIGMNTIEIDDQRSIYRAISEMNTYEEMEQFIKNKLVYPMTDMIVERTDLQFKSIAEKMLHIIHTEYDTDLSLETIASRLHYNKNYLSSIFKKEFHQSFSKYVALYRFDMAKKWLKETNLSVREISERLQYNNSQNFIRSFQKVEGTTPGKYRDLHRDDSLTF